MKRIFTGIPFEAKVGYCRALRKENFIFVSGTTSFKDGKVFAPGDSYKQTRRCLEIIEEALGKLGAQMKDVVRTRLFVHDISKWEDYARAHSEAFKDFPPTTGMYEVQSLIDPDLLVEIEVDAMISSG